MGRPNYACTTCSEHFTRKYSAKRHNITVHHNTGADIVPLVEYLVGRNSGRYEAGHPSWYRRSKEKRLHNFGHATAVADSMGDASRTGAVQRQQQGQYQSQYHQQSLEEQERHRRQQQQQSMSASIPAADQPQDVLPYPTDRTSEDEETTALSQETTLKIQELKRLVYRYAQYYRNPDVIIKCATFWSINGDYTILDEKLEHLRGIDAISNAHWPQAMARDLIY